MPRSRKSTSSKPPRKAGELQAYDDKRDFDVTPEPGPERVDRGEGPLTFVIQKHDASRLHYDFRLELDGVLKSWSVPKGPSLDPQDKRLAVMVEDHPIDYGSFEGIIPKGQYGAGEVIVWDNGTYSPDEDALCFVDRASAEDEMRAGIAAGKISITMRGRKMKGSWTLVKIARAEKEWLLIKHQDAWVDAERDITEDDRSVISELSIEDLQAGQLPDRASVDVLLNPADATGAKPAPLANSMTPMLATLADKPFSNADWLFEPKLDGVRALALIDHGDVKIISRRGLDATKQYPVLAGELSRQPGNELVLDGEIVALDSEGRPAFELIQPRLNLTRDSDIKQAEASIPVYYYVFDLLRLDGYDLRRVPLDQRKSLLERVIAPTNRIRLVEHFEAAGELAYKAAIDHGLEGIMAKRRDSTYQSGERSKAWLKIKGTQSDEFVVGGYSQGEGSRRSTLGSLLLGQYDDQGLVFVGNVGSGFDDRTLDGLRERLDAIKTSENPFSTEPPLKGPTTYVKPEVVAEVKFAQRTRDGYLRAPVFLRMRDDKPPGEVRHVDAVHVESSGADNEPSSKQSPVSSDDIGDVLEQLRGSKERLILKVEGHNISLTNLDKPLWPKLGRRRALTKRDLLVYFAEASIYLVPHLRDRPLTLTRYPNGVSGKFFFQKHWEAPLPEFVDTVMLWSSHNDGDGEYLLCNNLPTLLWLGQLADIELHTWYSRVDPEPDAHDIPLTFAGSGENIDASLLNYPDFIVFDLDPYIYAGNEAKGDEPALNKKAFAKTCEVARWTKDVLDSLSLSSFIKTSGKTGLHVYVPILRNLDYNAVRAACETIGHFVLRAHPRDVTMEWTIDKRAGKVFFDHNQNVRGKTLASIYSPRPSPEAAVSMPLRWDELEDIYPPDFTILSAPKRLAETGDLWANILDAKHDLRGLLQIEDSGAKSSGRRKR
jgi:bifunctional non-homologous end joining protein LigD